ncbi:cupin domain-containing protein [Halomarina litorea]|uniref:cupin domain-containing protein n=1 Tax=Halomarina litorea TaxID=2961595 RepID=UPI0020C2225F|nr:cupin domain-containing protein [Halomarina sp. BCD28]
MSTPRGVATADLELSDDWYEDDPSVAFRDNFPLTHGVPGATDIASTAQTVVYAEIDPGKALGTHIDSTEELVVVLDGDGELTVAGESEPLSRGGLALVPPMAPHGIRNVRREVTRFVAVFPTTDVTTTFDRPLQPYGQQVFATGNPAA